MCETNVETNFAPYWVQHPNRRQGEYLGLMTQMLAIVCRPLGINPPIMNATLATDMGYGYFQSADLNDVITGASIFRLRTFYSPAAHIARERNYVYNAVGNGAGVVQMEAMTSQQRSRPTCGIH